MYHSRWTILRDLRRMSMQDFLNVAVPGYKASHRHTVRRRLSILYHKERKRVKEILRNVQAISLTTDVWRSTTRSDHEIEENVSDDTSECSTDEEHDEAKGSCDTSSEEEENDESDDKTVNVQELSEVENIENEKERGETELLIRVHNVLKKTRAIISLIRRSSVIDAHVRLKAKNRLIEVDQDPQLTTNEIKKKLGTKVSDLFLDFIVRWNSTFRMVKRFLTYREVISALIAPSHLVKDLKNGQVDKLKSFEFTHETWDKLASLKRIMEPFSWATKMLSGRTYETLAIAQFVMKS
ncbi:unnamed protein product [Didymodactylos carnosus]|uniref:Uncharacterized protein n=1 Tax=Didymodactylos carnosus TaxID=1234261 RepID=A0A815VC50_9BILA|nr:unnamed protein product [Didymodactylos carnosus]CAF4389766.1 unnamed protein product [Didymodactylos carnosus]